MQVSAADALELLDGELPSACLTAAALTGAPSHPQSQKETIFRNVFT